MTDDAPRRPLVVLGMHRSGTSALAGALGHCGAWLGTSEELTEPSVENPKGFWERRDLRALCDELLVAAGADWWRVSNFETEAIPHAARMGALTRFRKIIGELDAHGTWAIKEPRLCLLLPVLRAHLTGAVCVHVYRNPLEVAQSLRVRNGFGIAEGLALWELYNLSALRASKGLKRTLIGYEELVARPADEMAKLLQRLKRLGVGGLRRPDEEAISAFVSHDLHRERASIAEAEPFLTDEQRLLWSRFQSGAALRLRPRTVYGPTTRRHLRDLESRVLSLEGLQSDLAEQRQQSSQLRRQLQESQQQGRDTADELRRQRQRDTRFEKELEESQRQGTRVTQELETERARSAQLQEQLHESRLEAKDAAARLTVEKERSASLQEELRRSERTGREAVEALKTERERVVDLQNELRESQLEGKQVANELAAERSNSARLERQLQESERDRSNLAEKLRMQAGAIEELAGKVETEQNRGAELADEVIALRNSTSWRFTAPMRAVSRAFKSIGKGVRSCWRLLGWLCTGQFGRAGAVMLPYYRRYVPRLLKRSIPRVAREALLGWLGSAERVDSDALRKQSDDRPVGLGAETGAGGVPGRAKARFGGLRRRPTVAIIAWDVGHNPVGRAHLLAQMLSRYFNVTVLGPAFPRFGGRVWEPLEGADPPVVPLPGEDLPQLLTLYERVAQGLIADAAIVCKPRLPSLLLGQMVKQSRSRPVFLDVDDSELAFTEAGTALSLEELTQADPDELRSPHSDTWTRFCDNYMDGIDGLLVSNETLQARYGGVIVPHARDEEVFNPKRYDRQDLRRRLGFGDDDRVVLFAGTPRAHKGVLAVANAVRSSNRQVRLLVIGTPPDPALGRELRAAGGARLTLLGNCPLQDLPRYVACADAVCLLQDPDSAVAQYQIPAKLTESLAFGLPVLASPVPPLRPFIDQGLIFETSPQTLGEDLDRVLGSGDSDRSAARRRREYFLGHMSYEAVGGELSSLLDRTIEKRTSAPPSPTTGKIVRLASQLPTTDAPVEAPAAPHGLDVVVVWKQRDLGLYGRRPDMLIKYLAARDDVRRVLVLEPPLSYETLCHWAGFPVTHQNRCQYVEWLRKSWGAHDTGKVSFHSHLYSDRGPSEANVVWHWPRRADYLDSVEQFFAAHDVDASESVFLVYPRSDDIPALLERFQPRRVVADVVDDERAWPHVTSRMRRAISDHYREVLSASDFAVTNCEPVREAMQEFHDDVRVLPNAIDLSLEQSLPLDSRYARFDRLDRPRIGYVGNLEQRIDLELIRYLAKQRPGWQLVLVGSTHANPEVLRLAELPNVHLPGVVLYEEAKHWIRGFDVAIIPHKRSQLTRHMNPLKLYLYQGMGVPVVSTAIENLGDFEEFIRVAGSREEFLTAVEAALDDQTGVGLNREEVVNQNTWQARVETLLGWLAEVGPRATPVVATRFAAGVDDGDGRVRVAESPDRYESSCAVCGDSGTFEREHRSIREGYQCASCGSSLRYRGQAQALLRHYSLDGATSVADLARQPDFRELAIYEPGVIGPFRRYFSDLPRYRQSVFSRDRDGRWEGLESQDLTELSYPSESFDLVLTSDIFEHIRRPFVAFEEIRRVLKPGGRHIFSIPVTAPMPCRTVSRVDTLSEEDLYLLTPRYHGDGMGGRALVYTDFGADLIEELGRMGLPTEALPLEAPHPGLQRLLTFVSQKPSDA